MNFDDDRLQTIYFRKAILQTIYNFKKESLLLFDGYKEHFIEFFNDLDQKIKQANIDKINLEINKIISYKT